MRYDLEKVKEKYGAKEWNKPGTNEKRYYVDVKKAFEMEFDYYNTGNIKSAFALGGSISNSEVG